MDLDAGTYECSSTVSGAFNNQPDQIKIILDDPQGIVYFCEDGGNDCGIHGRDSDGRFFSIVDGPGYNTETTGLAFSPDAKYMFVSFQGDGVIWQFWREDGLPFTGNPSTYHSTAVQNTPLCIEKPNLSACFVPSLPHSRYQVPCLNDGGQRRHFSQTRRFYQATPHRS